MGTESEAMGDDVHRPAGTNGEQQDAARLDLQDAVGERTYDDTLDEGCSPPDEPLGVNRHGTTAAERHDGESLDQAAAGAEGAAVHIVGEWAPTRPSVADAVQLP